MSFGMSTKRLETPITRPVILANPLREVGHLPMRMVLMSWSTKLTRVGFNPKRSISLAVEDTNEVAEAKANFYTLFKEHEAKVQEALENDEAVAEVVDEAVIDVRKREAEEEE